MCENDSAADWRRICVTVSEEETRAVGERLSSLLAEGDLVLISGELGAGKTRLVQGIARGLGVSGPVTSPTFALVKEYSGRISLFHADLYRLSSGDLPALGLDEYLVRGGVLCVEWGERASGISESWSDDTLLIDLEWLGDDERRIVLRGFGPGWRLRASSDLDGGS